MQAKHLKALFTLLFILGTATGLVAQKGRLNPEMRKELRAYNKENILPVLRAQRIKLDAEIAAADKREIEQLRIQRKQLQQEAKELRGKYKAQPGTDKTPLTDAQKAEFKALREKRKQVYQAAAAIARKYKPQLESIKADLADDRTKWETDLKAIVTKYNPELADRAFDAKKRGPRAAKLTAYKQLTRPAHFILWDANRKQKATSSKKKSSVYPNPTNSTNTLEYTVAKKGNVKITLLDANGSTLRTLLNEQQTKGSHTLEVNLTTLPNATYYYKIETTSGTETRRILKR